MNQPLVSVVVPVYNVAQYLPKCLDSIVNQTYKNLEIILVNDGSTDNSLEIIHEYAKKDSRIMVIDQENGGLSDARNTGVKQINGEYIVFVDSDDWLKLTMIQKMVTTQCKYQADCVQVGFYYAYSDYLLLDNRIMQAKDEPTVMCNVELMKALAENEQIKNFAWGKLYKRTLIEPYLFEKGKLFEDVFWAHQIMQQVKTYVINPEPLCYYRQREQSISGKYTIKNLDIIEGLKQRREFYNKYYPQFVPELNQLLFKTIVQHYGLLQENAQIDSKKWQRRKLRAEIINHYQMYIDSSKSNKTLLWQVKAFKYSYRCYQIVFISNKILKKIGIINKELPLKRVEYGND
ncbi:MAG: glycosyltransferase family 2 protein [Culicoidibacterales bacterium]